MLKCYACLCIQVLGGPYGMSKLKPESVMYKANVLPDVQ